MKDVVIPPGPRDAIAGVQSRPSPSPQSALARLAPALSFACGAALLAYILRRFGSRQVWLDLQSIGWCFGPIVALELATNAFNALAWWLTFPPRNRRGQLIELFLVRLAGSALNQTIPAAAMGGEPIKVLLLRHRFPLSMATASVLSAKLADALARALFISCGMLLVSRSLKAEVLPVESLSAGFVLTAAGIALFMALQVRGLADSSGRLAAGLRSLGKWGGRIELGLTLAGRDLRELYKSRPRDFAAATALSFAAQGFGVVQVWLLMGGLGLGRDWFSSIAIEAFSVLVSFVLFVVPGSLGVQEGGKVLIFAALGLPISAGLSMGVAFRLNALAIVAVGFAALVWLRARKTIAVAPDSNLRDAAAEASILSPSS